MFIQERLINGDSKALEKIYGLYFPRVYGLCMKYVKNEEIASDIVQEVFLKLWKNRKNISLELPIDQQLFVITKNIVFDHFRKKATEAKMLAQYHNFISQDVQEETLNEDIRLKKIQFLIKKLPKQQRQVIEMAKYQGFTYEEIATELNISKNTVSSHFSAAMKYLKEHLKCLILLALIQ